MNSLNIFRVIKLLRWYYITHILNKTGNSHKFWWVAALYTHTLQKYRKASSVQPDKQQILNSEANKKKKTTTHIHVWKCPIRSLTDWLNGWPIGLYEVICGLVVEFFLFIHICTKNNQQIKGNNLKNFIFKCIACIYVWYICTYVYTYNILISTKLFQQMFGFHCRI